jgi:TRAP-type C4-dicarboxylate transport system substrate-binding protein
MIEDTGVKIYKPTAAEKKQFMEACEPVYSYFIDKGVFTQAELDEVRRVAQGN